MIELHATGWFNIAGRGRIAAVDLRELPAWNDPSRGRFELPLRVHQHVLIDGSEYEIRGIETSTGLSVDPKVGLLVRNVNRHSNGIPVINLGAAVDRRGDFPGRRRHRADESIG